MSRSAEPRWAVALGSGVAAAIPACVWFATHMGDMSEGDRLVGILVETAIFGSIAGGLAVLGQLLGEGVRAMARR